MACRNAGAKEYLEATCQLGELGEEATTSGLAEWLEAAPPTVNEMIQRLGEQGFVDHQSYRLIRLTEARVSRNRARSKTDGDREGAVR